MQKQDIVRLTDQERSELTEVVRKLKGTGQKVRRAQMLLKADADGPSWTTGRSRKPLAVAPRRWRTSVSVWSNEDLQKLSMEPRGSSRRWKKTGSSD